VLIQIKERSFEMEPQELSSKLRGVIAFPVTPFHNDLTLNLPGLKQNLERLLQHPISAIIAAGGTGELYSLTPDEHQQVVETTVQVVDRRVPVLTGVGFNQQLAVQMAQRSAKAGVDGVLAFPPYYPNAEDEGLISYYGAIGKATNLGMAIYSRDWAVFNPDLVERLTEIPTLIAWKDGQGDMRRYQMIMNRVGDRLRWIGGAGDDLAPSYYRLGIRAYTSSLANFAPMLSLAIHTAASGDDAAQLERLMANYVVPHYAFRARRKGFEVSVVKAKMDILGLAGGPVRPPLVNPDENDKASLKRMLDSWQAVL
jgi:5-dehydro-4-deoxyglucarate dehydratase